MLPSFCNDEIIRVRPATKTERGSVIPDWDPEKVEMLEIDGCSVQPAATTSTFDGRVNGTTEQLTAYLPEDADVEAGDRIIYEGDTYTIMGKPKKWKGARNLSNIQLTLEKWEG